MCNIFHIWKITKQRKKETKNVERKKQEKNQKRGTRNHWMNFKVGVVNGANSSRVKYQKEWSFPIGCDKLLVCRHDSEMALKIPIFGTPLHFVGGICDYNGMIAPLIRCCYVRLHSSRLSSNSQLALKKQMAMLWTIYFRFWPCGPLQRLRVTLTKQQWSNRMLFLQLQGTGFCQQPQTPEEIQPSKHPDFNL